MHACKYMHACASMHTHALICMLIRSRGSPSAILTWGLPHPEDGAKFEPLALSIAWYGGLANGENVCDVGSQRLTLGFSDSRSPMYAMCACKIFMRVCYVCMCVTHACHARMSCMHARQVCVYVMYACMPCITACHIACIARMSCVHIGVSMGHVGTLWHRFGILSGSLRHSFGLLLGSSNFRF